MDVENPLHEARQLYSNIANGPADLQAIISVCLCYGIINKEFYQLAFGFY